MMRNRKKIIRIGFDLDGVLVDKLPLIPKTWLEYLFRGRQKNGLHYRYPKIKLEIWIRKFFHFYLFRPPLKGNIKTIRKLKKQGYQLYLISGRYSFLKKETMAWLKKRNVENLFEGIYINLKDEQPYIFKERMIEDLNLDGFFEDDKNIVNYLSLKKIKTKVLWVNQDKNLRIIFNDEKEKGF